MNILEDINPGSFLDFKCVFKQHNNHTTKIPLEIISSCINGKQL